MDLNSHNPSSLTLELKIIKARNVHLKNPHRRELFIRCYLPTGNADKTARLETQPIISMNDFPTWDQTFSLSCLGAQSSIDWLQHGTLTFELRCRTGHRVLPCIGKGSSRLVGRVEVPWKELVESSSSSTMAIEKWVVMIPKNNGQRECHDVKPPAVQITMKVIEGQREDRERLIGMEERVISGRRRFDHDEFSCKSCVAYEFFAIEASLEGF